MGEVAYLQICLNLNQLYVAHLFTPYSCTLPLSYFIVIAIPIIDDRYRGIYRTIREKSRNMLMFLISYTINFSGEIM